MGLPVSKIHLIIAGNEGVSGTTNTSGTDSAGGTQGAGGSTSSGGSVAEKVKAQLDSMLSEVGAKKNVVSAEMSDLICQQQSIQWPTKGDKDYDQKKAECAEQSKELGAKIKAKNEEWAKLTALENELNNAKSTAETLTDVDIANYQSKVDKNINVETKSQPQDVDVTDDSTDKTGLPEYVPSSDNSDKSPRQKELEYRLEELKTQYTGTQEALSNVEYRIEVISKQQNRLETSIGRLEVERDAVDAELSKLKDGYPTADKYFKEDGTFDNASFEADVSKYNAEIEKLQRDKEGIQYALDEKNKQNNDIEQELAKLHSIHEARESQLEIIKTKYERAFNELKEIENITNVLETDLTSVESEETQAKLADINTQKEYVEKQLEQLKEALERAIQNGDAKAESAINSLIRMRELELTRLNTELAAYDTKLLVQDDIEEGFKLFDSETESESISDEKIIVGDSDNNGVGSNITTELLSDLYTTYLTAGCGDKNVILVQGIRINLKDGETPEQKAKDLITYFLKENNITNISTEEVMDLFAKIDNRMQSVHAWADREGHYNEFMLSSMEEIVRSYCLIDSGIRALTDNNWSDLVDIYASNKNHDDKGVDAIRKYLKSINSELLPGDIMDMLEEKSKLIS